MPYADREKMRLGHQEFVGLPTQLMWWLVAGVAVCIAGGFQGMVGQLKPITVAEDPQYVVVYGIM